MTDKELHRLIDSNEIDLEQLYRQIGALEDFVAALSREVSHLHGKLLEMERGR